MPPTAVPAAEPDTVSVLAFVQFTIQPNPVAVVWRLVKAAVQMPHTAHPTARSIPTDEIGGNSAGGDNWKSALKAKAVTITSTIRPSRHISFKTLFMPNLL
jgi:hypothetical protein